ncbi:uncharacterized protein LOC133841593 [Drosophila sulfurigaster albostrigata]|uniref:uncharacterized protein LOC133841593 n=1 Tax=Drosophila sulfurigaster albostrigata TaxID=89887 RepID=UPI002D21D64E|nr:uncharacterized protein LOC133841593 [Drosophila sulfurigaster albostrigata]
MGDQKITKCDAEPASSPLLLPDGYSYFQDGIKWVSDLMEIEDSDADWLVDAEFICKRISDVMSKKDWIYKSVLEHLLTTATFYRGSKIDVPLDFEQYLRFQMPFHVTPIFNASQPGYINLYASSTHPMITKGYVNPELVQVLLRGNLRDAINQLKSVYCDSKVHYKLSYRTHEIGDQGFVHEILACEQRDGGMPSIISFVFLPALQFKFSEFPLPSFVPSGPAWAHCNNVYYWLALLQVYPQYDNRSFCPYVPRMQFVQDDRMVKYRNVLRLLVKIGLGNNIPDISDIFVIKGLHFFRLRYSMSCDCNLSLPTLFMELLNIHTNIIYTDATHKLMVFGNCQQHSMQEALKLDTIARNVSMFYYMNYIPWDRLKQMFGLI